MSFPVLLLIAVVSWGPDGALPPNEASGGEQVVDSQRTPRAASKQQDTSGTTASIVPPAKKAPYSDLFQFRAPVSRNRGTRSVPLAKPPAVNPRIVCGLAVWQVDPQVDSKIFLPVPDNETDFKIRRIVPPVCRD